MFYVYNLECLIQPTTSFYTYNVCLIFTMHTVSIVSVYHSSKDIIRVFIEFKILTNS